MRRNLFWLAPMLLCCSQERCTSDETCATETSLLARPLLSVGFLPSDLAVPVEIEEPDPFHPAFVDHLFRSPLALVEWTDGYRAHIPDASPLQMLPVLHRHGGRLLGLEREDPPAPPAAGAADSPAARWGGMERAVREWERFARDPVPEWGEAERALFWEEVSGSFTDRMMDPPDPMVEETEDGEFRRWMHLAAMWPAGRQARLEGELLRSALALVPGILAAGGPPPGMGSADLALVVGTGGDDFHAVDRGIVIDPGGDDRYILRERSDGFLLIVDCAGDDFYTYTPQEEADAPFFRLIWDNAGDDIHTAARHGIAAAFVGADFLVDAAGDDRYSGGFFSIGAASFGTAILWDGAGRDTYASSAFSQGLGETLGFGVLIDQSSGDDQYTVDRRLSDPLERSPRASISMAQGFGHGSRPYASGGIGVLMDCGGDDRYVADYFAQGGAYWLAAGALIDLSGDDQYLSRRYSQGAGIHLAHGILRDFGGNDRYDAWGVAQGCGHDLAAGVLLDGSGDDVYRADFLSLGAGNANGIGLAMDLEGDDQYQGELSQCLGWGEWNRERRRASLGILLDATGEDRIARDGLEGRQWYGGRYGTGIDWPRGIPGLAEVAGAIHWEDPGAFDPDRFAGRAMPLRSGKLPDDRPWPENPEGLEKQVLDVLRRNLYPEGALEKAKEDLLSLGEEAIPILLLHANTGITYRRIAILDTLERMGARAVPSLAARLDSEDGDQARLAAYLLARIPGEASPHYPRLSAWDHFAIRAQAAHGWGGTGATAALSPLFAATADPHVRVRESAFAAIEHLAAGVPAETSDEMKRFLADREAAWAAGLLDDSAWVRMAARRALSSVRGAGDAEAFEAWRGGALLPEVRRGFSGLSRDAALVHAEVFGLETAEELSPWLPAGLERLVPLGFPRAANGESDDPLILRLEGR